VVAGNAPWATLAWTASLAVSYLAIMIAGPIIGAYADAHAVKKRLLVLSTSACVIATAGLALVGPGDLVLGAVLLILSNFSFSVGENLIAAFLPELATTQSLGRVSGWGWSLGYCGGLLSLGVSLAYVHWAQAHGIGASGYVPVCMLLTAALYAAASLPTFIFLRERATPQPLQSGRLLAALTRITHTLHNAQHYRDLWRFLVCVVFYQAGVQTVIVLAAIYAQQALHFTTTGTIKMIAVVNITAAVGAWCFGAVQDRLGHKLTIGLTLMGWLLTVVLAGTSSGPAWFWVAANTAGLCLGASQSAARALVAYLSPADRRAEYFGLWGLAVRLSAILGPITYGMVTWLSGNNHRLAILVTGIYFLVGLALLRDVDTARGHRATLEPSFAEGESNAE
jgi:UMF1 family MFS transporter